MQDNKQYTPELRFPEFHDHWQVKRLEECFCMLQNNTLSRTELNEKCGDYQNIHYGDVLIKYGSILDVSKEQLPYINSNNTVEKYEKSLLKDSDVIIADTAEDETVGKCTEIINVGNKKIISGLHTIPIRPTVVFAKCFIGLYLNSNVWHSQLLRIMQGTKVVSISKSQLKNIAVCFPTLAEQRKIADCLSALDDLINAVGDKIELLKQHKKGLMQKLFPKTHGTTCGRGNGHGNGRDAKFCVSTNPTIVPELRFPEFSGDWQVKRLGAVADRITRKNSENNQNVLTISSQYGLISQYDYFNKNVASNDVTNYYLIHKGEFAYNKSRSGGYEFGAIKPLKQYEKGVVSTLYICFGIKGNNDKEFCEQYFETTIFNNQIGKVAQEGARNHGLLNISADDFFNLQITLPTLAEQRKIAACLSSIDTAIEETEKKLQMLQQHKKGLMQRMFVRRV